MKTFNTVDDYIGSFPNETQSVLKRLRTLIRKTVPESTEDMAYKMPSYKLYKKPLVYFAAWQNHISLYPTPNGMEAFEKELAPYKSGKGTAQFPLDKPLPYDVIGRVVKFRENEILKSSTGLR